MINIIKIKNSNIYTKTLIIFLLIIILIFFKNLFFTYSYKENYQNYTLKQFSSNYEINDIYDDFYANVYDDLYYDENRIDFEISHIKNLINNNKYFSKLVDLGCGTGHLVGTLNDLNINSIGVDISPHMVNKANDYYKNNNFKNADIMDNMLFEGSSINIITCLYFTIYYIKDKLYFLRNCYNWLLPNGYFVLHLSEKDNFNLQIKDDSNLNIYDLYNKNNNNNNNKVIYFDNYKYKTKFELKNDEGIFNETFEDIKHNKIRVNNHKLNIVSIREILFLCSKIGFKYVNKINMGDCNYENQYLYIFKKPIY